MIKTAFTTLIFMSLLWFGPGVVTTCPLRCSCKTRADGSYVNCGNLGLKTPISPNDLPANVYLLDLSGNAIETIANYAFKARNSTRIKRLDLSRNGLKKIEPNAFDGLNRLTKIVLRENKLTTIHGDVFKNLKNVKKIDLSENNLFELNKTQFSRCKDLRIIDLSSNKLSALPDGLFSSLEDLKEIDLKLNPMICDCNLKWMVKWLASMKRKDQKPSVLGRCKRPFAVRDKDINSLDKREMVCGKLKLPVMSFGPQGDQIAFKGDNYNFECNFSWIPGIQMKWYKDNDQIPVDPQNKHRNVVYMFHTSQVVLSATLSIKQLNVEDSGHYSCIVTYQGGYQFTRNSHLSVIPSNAPFCQAATTVTAKGTFHWHHTAAGGAAFLPCPLGIMSSFLDHGGSVIMARRNCSLKGDWMEVEAAPCVHANEITRALHELKEKPVNDTTVSSVSEQLLNISRWAKDFSSPLDVVYTAEVVDNLAHAIGRKRSLNENFVNTISNIMETDEELLLEAQERSKACSSMVLQLDVLLSRFPPARKQDESFVSKNIAVYLVRLTPSDRIIGKMCYVKTGQDSSFKEIDCLPCRNNSSCEKQKVADTSVYLPSSLFQPSSPDENVTFEFIVYSNGKLFPEVKKTSDSEQEATVITSRVVSLQFEDATLANVTHPVIYKLRNHQKGEQPLPVYWDYNANGGLGGWKENTDCSKVSFQGSSTATQCLQRSNKNFFAVMMNVSMPVESRETRYDAASLKFLHGVIRMVVFVAAGIASLLILITMIIYAVMRELRFDRDDAAMLMNLCLALLVAIVVFVTGVNHVSNKLVCRSVGVLLHYFLLCSLLWIGCSGICLHRLIRTSIKPEEYNPVLRYYMMSWGIPLIICGITIAGNVENYRVEEYCWLRPNSFYGGFLGPACLITLIDVIIFLRLSNMIKETYDGDASSQAEPENDAETTAEENALVIQRDTLPNGEENVESDYSALPDRGEMDELLRGNCVILLLIVLNVTLGISLIRSRQHFPLYITLGFLFAMALVVLGVVVFLFHCYRKEKLRRLWRQLSCKCCCFLRKSYETQEESPQDDTVNETPVNTTTADTANGEAEQLTGEEIHGAENLLSAGDGDSLSNVSLPSLAAIKLDKQQVDLPEKEVEVEVEVEKALSVSDKQSWASAPLPLQYKSRGMLHKNPPGSRHSYAENSRSTPTIEECRKAPLAPPEGTASSIESGVQLPTDTASNLAPSEGPPSVREAMDGRNVSRNTNTSCSASEASISIDLSTTKKRPPVPGSSSHGSDGAPPLPPPPFRKTRASVPAMRDSPVVSRPQGIAQELIDQYSIPVGTNNSIPRQIPRDHVVVRERYHIPYEPRAVSEKPRDHYQILPLPRGGRDHYLVQPGHDHYEDTRGQPLSPNPYQAAPEHYPIPGEQNPGQPTYDVNQVPSPSHPRAYEYYHLQCDSMPSPRPYDLYQMARDQASPRSHDSCQAPHEQSLGHGQADNNPVQRLNEQPQISADNICPRSPNPSEPSFGPRSPDHSRVSHDSSVGQRSHDHCPVIPHDHMTFGHCPSDGLYENIPPPSDQSSVPRSHERNGNEFSRDLSAMPRDQNMPNETGHAQTQEGVERPRDQYAGEGPREQPQALNPGEKSTAANQRAGVSLDKNAVRSQNAQSGIREQPKGIHVSRRRSRNPYQIARDIHHNLGIETRRRDRQSRRQHRVPPADQSSQPPKTDTKLLVSSAGETPREPTPRSSMSSWKEDRPKPAKRAWVSEVPKSAVFVPLPHMKHSIPEPPRNETSV